MEHSGNTKNIAFPVMIVISILSIIIMIFALTRNTITEESEFKKPEFDSTAVRGVPDISNETSWSELDAQAFKVSLCGKIKIIDGKADIWFTNPESNEVWMKLRALDENGDILGETGLIRPGEYIQSINFDIIPETEEIFIKVMAYEPEVYYSAGSVTLRTLIEEDQGQ